MPYIEYTPEQLASEEIKEFPASFCRAVGATSVRYEVEYPGRSGSQQHARYIIARDDAGRLIDLDGMQRATFDAQLTHAMREQAH